MSGESMRPLEYQGVRYQSSRRACDDPELNFQKIRDHRLWLKHAIDEQAKAEKQTKVEPRSKPA